MKSIFTKTLEYQKLWKETLQSCESETDVEKAANFVHRYYDSGTHLFKEMDDRNLFLTFIALVVYEKKINPPFGLGSTTPAKFCYRELLQRVVNLEFTLDFIYDVGDWAAEYSYNKEIPMGGHGGPREYFAFWRQYEERTKKEKEDAIIRRKEKKRLKAEAHAERLRKKEIRDRELGYKK